MKCEGEQNVKDSAIRYWINFVADVAPMHLLNIDIYVCMYVCGWGCIDR